MRGCSGSLLVPADRVIVLESKLVLCPGQEENRARSCVRLTGWKRFHVGCFEFLMMMFRILESMLTWVLEVSRMYFWRIFLACIFMKWLPGYLEGPGAQRHLIWGM